jgi:hypothetical protein
MELSLAGKQFYFTPDATMQRQEHSELAAQSTQQEL